MKVYALCVGTNNHTLYETKELARKALKKTRDEIVARNVNTTCDTPDRFSFYFGYEEHGATWFVKEIVVIGNEAENYLDGYYS